MKTSNLLSIYLSICYCSDDNWIVWREKKNVSHNFVFNFAYIKCIMNNEHSYLESCSLFVYLNSDICTVLQAWGISLIQTNYSWLFTLNMNNICFKTNCSICEYHLLQLISLITFKIKQFYIMEYLMQKISSIWMDHVRVTEFTHGKEKSFLSIIMIWVDNFQTTVQPTLLLLNENCWLYFTDYSIF